MEFYGSMEAKDRFGVVGRFGFVSCGFMGVLCCSETQDRWWRWLQRIGLGWWVGLDLWVMDLWVCCVAVKPQTSGGWLRRINGCAGYVVVMVPMAKPQVQNLDQSSWRSPDCF